jgi:RNA polymerase sigma-70 factor (ECF subfamily)
MVTQDEMRSDEELLESVSRQDVKAFDTLYEKYNRLLYKRVYRRLENHWQSQEVMQNLWISIWEKPSFVKTDERGSAKGFLYHYLSWRVLDSIRKEAFNCIAAANHEPLESVEDMLSYVHVSEEYEFKELELQIDYILNGLPEQTVEVFVLHWRKGYSFKEISNLLSMDEQTVRRKSKESISVLRRMLVDGKIDRTSFRVVRDTATSIIYILFVAERILNSS